MLCDHCKTPFVAKTSRQRYCCRKCKVAAQNKRYYRRHTRQIILRVVANRNRKRIKVGRIAKRKATN